MLPLPLADRLIDTDSAAKSALRITGAVDKLLNAVGLQVLDIFLFFDDTGNVLCGEISPDNMRIKPLSNAGDFDKDLWRKGRPAEEIIAQWTNLLSRLETANAN